MTTALDTPLDDLIVLRDQASALIRAEVRAGEQRTQLERAVREAILKLGADINEVSAASGLPPADIRRICESAPDLELDELTGVA